MPRPLLPLLVPFTLIPYAIAQEPESRETPQQTAERAGKEFAAFQKAPFFRMWAGAGIDEMASALHERLVMGSL